MLFAVLLGGAHPKASIEVHDIVFASGDRLEDTYSRLRAAWFGSPAGVHVDSWLEIRSVDGFAIELAETPPPDDAPRLFLLNLGGYEPASFGEAHHYQMMVARDEAAARIRAKTLWPTGWAQPHTDAVIDVDQCITVNRVDGLHVHLVPNGSGGVAQYSDYIPLP